MEQQLRDQLERLERAVADFERGARSALGFVKVIEFKGIGFNVSRRFVIADLAPLAFFHLVEHVEGGDATAAVVRLYERLGPLLLCRHRWTPLRRLADEPVLRMVLPGSSVAHVCEACTAYALGPSLPAVGRGAAPVLG